MQNYTENLQHKLHAMICEMAKHPENFCRNPGKDFIRTRKLPFEKVLSILLGMSGNPLRNELMEVFRYSPSMASVPAFVQQRNKIHPDALAYLFHRFTDNCIVPRHYRGYRLLAADGSDLQFAANPQDTDSYVSPKNGNMHYNLLYLNALYDLCTGGYLDAVVQKNRTQNEYSALIQMTDRSGITEPAILVADRGYESYNVMEHITQKGWKYLIRLRDSGGILSGISLPADAQEFDLSVQLLLVRKQTNAVKALLSEQPDKYRFLPSTVTFDYLPQKSDGFYPISFRIVRFPLSDVSTETLITNLDTESFPPEELKKLYHMRWGIETSFRHLKYTVGLRQFQSKKVEFVVQEIFARLIMYNLCEWITSHVVIQSKSSKYTYQANFAAAVHICRQLFRGSISPPDAEALIARHIVPFRPDRSSPRRLKPSKFNGFFYRIA